MRDLTESDTRTLISPRRSRPSPDGEQLYDVRRFVALLAAGSFSLAIWLGVVFTVSPERLLTYLAFFVPLSIALACLTAASIYRIRGGNGMSRPDLLRSAVRQGCLFACFCVVNLGLMAAHRWSVVSFVLFVTAAAAVEVYVWSRTNVEA